jgi:hypothetical protein
MKRWYIVSSLVLYASAVTKAGIANVASTATAEEAYTSADVQAKPALASSSPAAAPVVAPHRVKPVIPVSTIDADAGNVTTVLHSGVKTDTPINTLSDTLINATTKALTNTSTNPSSLPPTLNRPTVPIVTPTNVPSLDAVKISTNNSAQPLPSVPTMTETAAEVPKNPVEVTTIPSESAPITMIRTIVPTKTQAAAPSHLAPAIAPPMLPLRKRQQTRHQGSHCFLLQIHLY